MVSPTQLSGPGDLWAQGAAAGGATCQGWPRRRSDQKLTRAGRKNGGFSDGF